jgi:hypothetical protein
VLFTVLDREEHHPRLAWAEHGCVAKFRDLASLRFIAPDKSIVVNIEDAFSQLWAVYYLRDVNITLPHPVSYLGMPHILPVLRRAKPVDSLPIFGRLRDGVENGAVWTNGTFSVLPEDVAQIVSVSNPYGLETLDGQPFVWIGTDAISFRVMVPRTGHYAIRGSAFVPGPSLPERSKRILEIAVGLKISHTEFGPDSNGIPVNLEKGENIIRIACLDRPTRLKMPNGDTRPLLLGIKGYRIEPDLESAR